MAGDLDKVLGKLRDIDRKLDVLIEAQGLQDALEARKQADKELAAENAKEFAEQMRRARPR